VTKLLTLAALDMSMEALVKFVTGTPQGPQGGHPSVRACPPRRHRFSNSARACARSSASKPLVATSPCHCDRKGPVRDPGRISARAATGSKASSTPIRWPLACERSWPSAVRGWGAPPTFCGPAPIAAVMAFRNTVPAWPKNPRALAGRLRRAQTFLRAAGIEVAFGREGRAGTRVIRIHSQPSSSSSANRGRLETRTIRIMAITGCGNTVSIVSHVSDNGPKMGLNHPRPGLEQAL